MLELCDRRLEECGFNLCGNINCTCLAILLDDKEVRMSVAQYYITFAMKTKYEQHSIILDLYKYSQAAKGGNKHVWYCLPYNVSWCFDTDNYDSIFEAAKGAKPKPINMAPVTATGVPKPPAPSKNAPNEKAINNNCKRLSLLIPAMLSRRMVN